MSFTISRDGFPDVSTPLTVVTLDVQSSLGGGHPSLEELLIIAEITDPEGNLSHELVYSRARGQFFRGYLNPLNVDNLGPRPVHWIGHVLRDGGWPGSVNFYIRVSDSAGNYDVGSA